jgi:hypothetical protein
MDGRAGGALEDPDTLCGAQLLFVTYSFVFLVPTDVQFRSKFSKQKLTKKRRRVRTLSGVFDSIRADLG